MAKSLTLLLNIGKPDAQRLGLDKTLAGESVSPGPEAAAELLRRGWAAEAGSDRPAPQAAPVSSSGLQATPTVQASPGAPKLKATDLPDLATLTKAELEALARKHGIKDVHAGLSKDDMIAGIEDHLTR